MSNFMDKAKAKVKTAKDKTVGFVKDHATEIIATGITVVSIIGVVKTSHAAGYYEGHREGCIEGYNKGFSRGSDLQCKYDNAVLTNTIELSEKYDIKSKSDNE